ncbi:hypothetical protein [Streptomyces sp. NPDC093589]|uniref:hypothetical protein n=1 Tax=Streptomyces sp. NPDC093589 TaxID=3366043 RepID=UPI0038223845
MNRSRANRWALVTPTKPARATAAGRGRRATSVDGRRQADSGAAPKQQPRDDAQYASQEHGKGPADDDRAATEMPGRVAAV